MGKSASLTIPLIRDVMRLASEARDLRRTPVLQQQVLLDGMVELLGGERGHSITYKHFKTGAMPALVGFYLQPKVDPMFRSYLEQANGVTPWDDPMVYDVCANPGPTGVSTLSKCWDYMPRKDFRLLGDYLAQYKMADRISCTFRRPEFEAGITGLEVQRMDRAKPFSARTVAAGQLLVDELHHLHLRGQLDAPSHPFDRLPRRQREVAQRIVDGQNVKRIAFELGLSVHTVREYLKLVYRKFNASGRDELMARFVRA
jgi:DNA-binding CsgD family transcriptional regulator